jgi:2,3-dihydroxybenzoate-AMP ligase
MLSHVAQMPEEFARRYREDGYWRGETLGGLLRECARTDPGRTALVAGDERWSYARLDEKADRLAAGFVATGIGPGHRVLVQLPNIPEFVTVSVGLFRIGALPVFTLPSHRRNEISQVARWAEAVAYVIPGLHQRYDYRLLAEKVLDDAPSLQHVLVAGEPGRFTSLDQIEADRREITGPAPGDVAFFLLSGGTTGVPKLIPRTHDDYAFQLRATAEALDIDRNGVYLAAQPVASNAVLGCPGVLGTLRVGGKVVMSKSPSPDEVFPLIEREQVGLTTLMPPLVLVWLEAAGYLGLRTPGLTLQVGSARFAPELAKRVRPELGARLSHWFGMAEGPLTYTRADDPDDVVAGTQGRPLCPADELRVVGEDGVPVSPGEMGELQARGPTTIRGYYKAEGPNAESFTADGYLRTGDLVRITPAGNLVVEGRIKDVINRGGEKVSPGEVEDLLLGHPNVHGVAVVGIADEIFGEVACAVVVPRGTPPGLPALRAFLRESGLADYKLPDRLEITKVLPVTNAGKVNKAGLRSTLTPAGG